MLILQFAGNQLLSNVGRSKNPRGDHKLIRLNQIDSLFIKN